MALEELEWPEHGASLVRLLASDVDGPGSTLRDAYGEADALYLVRPDGYLAHVAVGDVGESTRSAVQRMTPWRARS